MRSYRAIFRLAWPLALGMINNAIMQFADRAYLARESMESLEAVLPAGVLAWIFMVFFQSIVGYAGVFVAQYHGANDERGVSGSYRAAMIIALIAGIVSLPLVPLGNAILSASASASLLARERAYYDVMIAGSLFVYVQMAASAYFTGRGEPKVVFWAGLIGNALNIALDPLLIFGLWGFPRLGIAGAAIATVFSTAVQAAILIAVIRLRRPSAPPLPAASLIPRILRFGVPAAFYEVLNLASFTIFIFVTEGVGHMELAVSNACWSLNYLLFAPMMGFSLAAQTLVGQCQGRADSVSASIVFRRTTAMALAFVVLGCTIILVFYRPILSLFAAGSGEEFYALGIKLLWLMTAWMIFDATDLIIAGALKGAGDTRFVLIWTSITSFAIWLPVVFIVRSVHNTMPALWATNLVYVMVTFVGSIIRWHRGAWRKIRLIEN